MAVMSAVPNPKLAKTASQFVSRGADKLLSVSQKLNISFRTKVVLDVGASTGGFSQVALAGGATKVYAVEVGTRQLAPVLRANARLISMEKTDIRDVKQLPNPINLALIDVSFMSIRLILPTVLPLLADSGQILAMVKPQFEVNNPDLLNEGVIKNDAIRRQTLRDFEAWAKKDFRVIGKADSGLSGSKGNLERFYLLEPIRR